MARRKQSGLDVIASMPWPVGVALGVVAYFAIRYGFGWYLSTSGSSLTQGLGRQLLSSGTLAPLAWLALAACWVAAIASFLARQRRRQLLAGQTGVESLGAMSWREFEMLVSEAFRRRGYAVEETGLGGPDGGIDLIVRKDGRKELVQCKQWRRTQVGVAVVREMWGLAAHHGVDGVRIVCVGEFTPDAAAFARGKPIELIRGDRLAALVREIQTPIHTATRLQDLPAPEPTPTCPTCAGGMTRRPNRKTGELFWGCRRFPQCRGTRSIG